MTQEIEHLYGFQKTTPDHLDSQTWQTVLDVFVKDKYRLGLGHFFAEQNPHARQTVLARLLEVDRQGIHRFNPADRKMLLTEYARSVARDGAACNAQVCGNVTLRRHVSQQLRASGESAEAAGMESAFRRNLEKQSAEPAVRKILQPTSRLADLRTLGNYTITWVKQLTVVWKVNSIPWWGWVGFVCAYVSLAGTLAHNRRKPRVMALTIFGKHS
jgi:cobalamin biosynthesis Mg chelatase CobN